MEKHDYTATCIYLITVTTVDRKRILGALVGDSADAAEIETTVLGRYVAEAFRKTAAEVTRKTGSRVQVLHYKVMPDHFHGILFSVVGVVESGVALVDVGEVLRHAPGQ